MAYYGRCESQQVGQLLPLISSLAPDMTYLMNEATTTSTTQAIGPDIPDTGMCIGAEATGTMSQHHTPISQPLPLVSLEPSFATRINKTIGQQKQTKRMEAKERVTSTMQKLRAIPPREKHGYKTYVSDDLMSATYALFVMTQCGSMVLVRLCILDLTQRLPDLGSMVLVRLCILDLTQKLPDLGSMVLVRLCILDLTQRLPDLGSMVLVRLCILDLTQKLPDLGRTKYNIDPARFVAVLIDRVAVSLSGCSRPSDKYVLAVYKYWRSNRGNLLTLLGELNDSTVTNPLEGDEIVPGPETNDVDEVEKGIIRVPEEEGDRIDALQACEKEDSLIQHGTVRMIM
eukprot:Em0007g1233a